MPYTKKEAHVKIQKLVEDFRAQEATLEKAPEAQIEQNFIRPLFRYLNWNTENKGLSHAHYEFRVQATNRKGLRPDYILHLDGRNVLVMDAKQVKYAMHDPRWLYQVYSYAYSTQNSKPSEKIDFAILTDFQEFIVLDCTLFAAKPEAVNNFRVIDWTYNDYVDKFDELWDLLERNNVMNDSRPSTAPPKAGGSAQDSDRGLWSRYLSPQKVKSNRVSPDKAFLAEMDDEKNGWRVLLAKDMKKFNPSADGELITAAVQLLIDRLVFIKALSDREVDKDYLGELAQAVEKNGLAEDNTGWFKSCQSLFEELNNFYNGSIFASRPELEAVTVSNKVVREVIKDLQPENSPYNFAVLPVEILGTIYERFLGRVVRTTEKQVKIEDKPEVRKAGGVYYTPQYIVDYIVKNTVGKLLAECKTPADVAKLKILDPACGSGSFLLGAYEALIDWHKEYFARAGKEKRDRESFYRDESGQIRLTAKLKRDILKNNLFGVDIDPQAVEVTRFSLSLKALEDLREGELTEERSLFHQTVLPDLSANIKNGNSLIGTDYFGLFQPTPEELKTVKPFDWKAEFKEIMENGGFDAVIGNPPWISLSGKFGAEIYPASQIEYLIRRFSGNTYMPNMYEYFVAQGINLTKQNGFFGFIVPDRLGFNRQFVDLRKRILDETRIVSLLYKAPFPGITADTLIFIFQKEKSNELHVAEISEFEKPVLRQRQFDLSGRTDFAFSYFENENVLGVTAKIESANTKPLKEFCDTTSGFGGKSSLITETKMNRNQIQTIKGESIGRYEMKKVFWFEFTKENITGRTTDPKKLGATPRILLRKTGDRIIATYDEEPIFPEQSLYFLFNKKSDVDYKYLLGILNSRLMTNYYRARLLTNKKSIAQVKKVDLDEIPIRAIDFANATDRAAHEKMVALVTSMLEMHKAKSTAKTQSEQDVYARQIAATDRQIDELVYQLYGLTEEEARIVENQT